MFPRYLALAIILSTLPLAAHSDELVWATGKVVGSDGKPLKGAVVVVYDDKEKIVDYAHTDEKGEYALAIPEDVLNLETKKGGGFISSTVGRMKRFVTANVTGLAQGAKTTILALTATQSMGLTAPIAKAALDTGTKVADKVGKQLTPKVAAEIQEKAVRAELKRPGVLYLKASAANHTDYAGLAELYWVQRETVKDEGKEKAVYAAWLDPINFGAPGKPSTAGSDFLKITAAKGEPSLVLPGGKFKLNATISTPAEPATSLIVIARSASGKTWELKPEGKGVYSAEIAVDEKLPPGEHVISILAYAAGEKPGRREDVEKEIEKAGYWDPKKEFTPNPLMLASRNRADVKVTLLPEKKTAGK